MIPATAISEEAEEVNDDQDDPIPNDLDNALVHLIPAITACGTDPGLPTYLDLGMFEKIAQPALRGGNNGTGSASKRPLDKRVSGEIEVAFRHCMHEAGLALVNAETVGEGRRGGSSGLGVGVAEKRRPRNGAAAAATVAGYHNSGEGTAALSESEVTVGMMSEPLGILSLALDFVWNEAGLNESGGGETLGALSGLPLILLEDFLESQGRKACKVFWSEWVEPNATRLTKLLLARPGGRYTLIRLCNKLAQRMSKTHDSSFCGQIHLFLAQALGFFERSGLNVTGGVNLQNVTAFEDEENFLRTMAGFDGEEAATATAAAAAAAAAAGASEDGDPMEVDSATGFTVDYPLYQSFWRLQRYALEQDKAVKGEDAKRTWETLLGDVDKILGAFEANAFSEHDLRLAREKWAADRAPPSSSASSSSLVTAAPQSTSTTSSSTVSKRTRAGRGGGGGGVNADAMEVDEEAVERKGGDPVYFGLKYLTSSRLLRLQLRDPSLRLQVLTQWLILAASLKSKIANTKDSPNSVEDLKTRIELAKRLVRATPPRGEEYLGMLQIVLNRESAWTQWKDVGKCKDVDPAAVQEAKQAEKDKAAGVVVPAPSYPNKRPRPSASVALAERAKYSPLGADYPLEQMVKRLRAGVPSAEEHLEDQIMCAEDPETPKSELPSANPLYTWRALRLLGRENPANLVGCHDGDLIKTMERMSKAQSDTVAAAVAEAEAEKAEKAEEVPPSESAPGQPVKEEASPPEAETEKQTEKEVTTKAMAVDGEEDGEVKIKTEVVAPAAAAAAVVGADAESTASATRSTNGGLPPSEGEKRDGGGVATHSGTVGSEATEAKSAAAVPATAEVPAGREREEKGSRGSAPTDVAPASTDADAPAAADVPESAATDAPRGGGDDGVGGTGKGDENGLGGDGGNGDGDSNGVKGAAADGRSVDAPGGGDSSPQGPESSNGGKGGAVAGSMAPVADTRPPPAAKVVPGQAVPSPTRMTRRRAKKAQNDEGK